MEIKENDFVILVKKYKDIELNSVGIIKASSPNYLTAFFIGKRIEVQLEKHYLKYIDVTKTGKGYEYKICNVCHVLKRYLEDFEVNQTDARGRKTTRPSCKSCRVDINGIALKSEEKKRLDKIKPKHFFVCPICQKGSIPNVTAKLVKDHDHTTGNARDWVCDSCNTGLGRFKDDIKLLERAISYLEKHTNQLKE